MFGALPLTQSPHRLLTVMEADADNFPNGLSRTLLLETYREDGRLHSRFLDSSLTSTVSSDTRLVADHLRPGTLVDPMNTLINNAELAGLVGFQDFYISITDTLLYPALQPEMLMERDARAVLELPRMPMEMAAQIGRWGLEKAGKFWEILDVDPDQPFITDDGAPVVYTDGSFFPDPQHPAGSAVVLSMDKVLMNPLTGRRAMIQGSNFAERNAMKIALNEAPSGSVIASDSTRALDLAARYPRVKSGDLRIAKVKAHSTNLGNDLADYAAKKARVSDMPRTVTVREMLDL